MYTLKDLREWVTVADVMDAHEALDLREAIAELDRKTQNGNRR